MTGIFLIMFGPALVFIGIALVGLAKKSKKMSKTFFILAGVYLLISLGVCGIVMANFTLDTK